MIANMVEAAVEAKIIGDNKFARLSLGLVLLYSHTERRDLAKQLDDYEVKHGKLLKARSLDADKQT